MAKRIDYTRLAGYLPVGKRPRCIYCTAELKPIPGWRDPPPRGTFPLPPYDCIIGWGYCDDIPPTNRFCTQRCGYEYGLQKAGGPLPLGDV